MLGLGMIKGTIIGMGIGLLAGIALKEMCKMKKTTSSDNINKNNEIEYGLGAIKGVADMFIKHICEARNKFKFRDLWDFSKIVDI